jgi:hypothetical protein
MRYILCLFFFFILPGVYAQQLKPLLHLVKGETYYTSSSTKSAMTQNILGRENKVNVALSFTIAFKVTNVKDTIYKMEARYQSIEMKIQMEDTSIEMNSVTKTPPGEKTAKPDTASLLVAGIVNKPFLVAMTVKGKVMWVKNLDKIIADVFNDFQLPDTIKRALVKNQFKQSFGENAFKGSLEMGVAIFQNAAVTKNSMWTVNSILFAPAVAEVRTVYQLTDITADFFSVKGQGTITNDAGAKPGLINGMPATYNLNGGLTADIKIERITGWIAQLTLKQFIEGEIDIMDNPKIPGGITIPVMFNTTVNVTNK